MIRPKEEKTIHIPCKINATKQQLIDIAIDEDITDAKGVAVHMFPDGWYIVEGTHEGHSFIYDIPSDLLKFA